MFGLFGFVIFSKNIIRRMSGKSCCRNNVKRNMDEKRFASVANLLWSKTFWKKMERNQKCRLGVPIGKVECNFVSVKNRVCVS